MEWMLMPMRRYADFGGRSRRMEYWMFSLGIFVVMSVFEVLFFSMGGFSNGFSPGASLLAVVLLLLWLAVIVPATAVTVRRLHDQNRSGWFILLGFIPFIGGLALLVLMFLEGTVGENRFGPDPKALTATAPA